MDLLSVCTFRSGVRAPRTPQKCTKKGLCGVRNSTLFRNQWNYRSTSEQDGRLSCWNSSWNINEARNAVLGAKFDCFKSSVQGAEFLRRHRKNGWKSFLSLVYLKIALHGWGVLAGAIQLFYHNIWSMHGSRRPNSQYMPIFSGTIPLQAI